MVMKKQSKEILITLVKLIETAYNHLQYLENEKIKVDEECYIFLNQINEMTQYPLQQPTPMTYDLFMSSAKLSEILIKQGKENKDFESLKEGILSLGAIVDELHLFLNY